MGDCRPGLSRASERTCLHRPGTRGHRGAGLPADPGPTGRKGRPPRSDPRRRARDPGVLREAVLGGQADSQLAHHRIGGARSHQLTPVLHQRAVLPLHGRARGRLRVRGGRPNPRAARSDDRRLCALHARSRRALRRHPPRPGRRQPALPRHVRADAHRGRLLLGRARGARSRVASPLHEALAARVLRASPWSAGPRSGSISCPICSASSSIPSWARWAGGAREPARSSPPAPTAIWPRKRVWCWCPPVGPRYRWSLRASRTSRSIA